MSDMKCPFCQQELEIVFKQAGHNLEEARDWYKAGMTQEAIALDFGVSQKCISNWVRKGK